MIPYIQKEPACFIVDGKPFIAYAGEVHNSNCSTIEVFREEVIQRIKGIGLNTLLLPVYWENIEPIEGSFDFSLVKALIDCLSENQLKGILLWFGLWKNGLSTYAPEWMKLNREVYPFCESNQHEKLYTISPLCQKACDKDRRAYEELLKFLKEYDQNHTIIMVQIENEIGLLGSERDYSKMAQDCFDAKMPKEVVEYFGVQGTWSQLGCDASELFMTYYFAKAIEEMAKSGKAIYPLATMMNVWLSKKDEKAGKYPSGGAVCKNLEFCRYLMPSIDVIAPDLYGTNFKEVCDAYSQQGILIIPETRQDRASLSQIIYGFSKYPLICYSPFGIEDFYDESNRKLYHFLASLGIAKDAFNPSESLADLCRFYADMKALQPLLLHYRGSDKLYPFLFEKEKGERLRIADVDVELLYLNREKAVKGAGFILALEDEWLIYGVNFFLKASSEKSKLGILSLESGKFEFGRFKAEKKLNGDEQYGIYALEEPKLFRVRFHRY